MVDEMVYIHFPPLAGSQLVVFPVRVGPLKSLSRSQL